MPCLRVSPSLPLLIIGGAAVGALSWLVASLVSGTFEPYDSGVGLLLNQIILSVPTAVLAWRHRITVPLLFMASAYLGLNVHACAFGGSEARAWALLGASVSVLLFPAPMVLALCTAAIRRRRRPSAIEATNPSVKEA